MPEPFVTVPVPRRLLVSAAQRLRDEGWRLVTASTVMRPDGRRVLYHFERHDRLHHLEVRLAADEAVPSLGSVYPGAFLVENDCDQIHGISPSSKSSLTVPAPHQPPSGGPPDAATVPGTTTGALIGSCWR